MTIPSPDLISVCISIYIAVLAHLPRMPIYKAASPLANNAILLIGQPTYSITLVDVPYSKSLL